MDSLSGLRVCVVGCGLLLGGAAAAQTTGGTTAEAADSKRHSDVEQPASARRQAADSRHQAADVERIVQRQSLRCGVDATDAEYTTTDDHGQRVAFDTALCRAVAVALLGPQAKFTVRRFQDDQGPVAALRSGEVDLVPTLSADLAHSTDSTLLLTTPVLHDAVTVLLPAQVGRASELRGKKICFLAETETEVALQDWDRAQGVGYLPFPFQEEGEMEAAFVTGNCAAMAGDATRLGGVRASLGAHAAGGYRVLPEMLRDDPLAMAVAAGSPGLLRVAQWTLEALLLAEQSGMTAANVADFPRGRSEAADRLLGRTGEMGRPFGLRESWAVDVISATGNYGELYEHTLGAATAMGISRGVNALCGAGGAMCPMPLK